MPRPSRAVQTRAEYARTSGNFLIGQEFGVDPNTMSPIWWYGLDSGGGSYPIGPNGPHGGINGYGPAVNGNTSAPSLAVVTRATSLITGPLTAAPYKVLDGTPTGQPLPTPRWLLDPMLLRPDSRFVEAIYPAALTLPRALFWASWIRDACWFGVGAFLCRDDRDGLPLAGTLKLVDPRALSTERDEGGLRWVIGGSDPDAERVVFDRDGRVQVGQFSYRIVTLRNPHSPVDVEGRSKGVFELSPTAFGIAQQIDTYSSGVYRTGVPAGYLKVQTPGLTEAQATTLKRNWLAAHGGDRRSIAVLNATTEFVPINLSPVDAGLDASKRLNIGDVAFAFGLDPLTLGVSLGNSATYNNTRDAWLNHRDFGLAPWISGVQDVLTSLLGGVSSVAVSLDGFANPPMSERVTTGKLAVEAGLITVNEWRASEGLPPLPEPVEPPQPLEVSTRSKGVAGWLR